MADRLNRAAYFAWPIGEKLLEAIPGGRRLYREIGARLTAGRKGLRGDSASSLRAMQLARPHLPPGGVAVDVGSGWFHRNAFLLALMGAGTVYLFDVEDTATLTHIRTYLADLLRNLERWTAGLGIDHGHAWGRLEHWLSLPSREAIYEDAGFRPLIVAPDRLGSVGLPPVDVMISNCVLPHIPPAMLVPELRDLGALLAPDGHQIHVIGHVDHWSWHAKGSNPFGHYRWSDETYRRWFESLEYQNRMTVPEYREAFGAAGLVADAWETETGGEDVASLSRVPLAPRFAAVPRDELAVRRSYVVLSRA